MEKLFQHGFIGNCKIKNRVYMTAMTTGFAGLDGLPTPQITDYYEERAKGGVGLIISEIFCINQVHGRSFPRQFSINDPANIIAFEQMTARIHRHDTKIFAQLHHGGSTNDPRLNGGHIKSAGDIPNAIQVKPEPLTLEEIEELKQQFVTSAIHCKLAHFDGVQIHCAHGYLLNQFLSSSSNNRTDQYGGSLENRCRLPMEIIRAIKAACGKDFPVTARISADEYDPFHPDSIHLEEGIEIAKYLEAAGADAIDVSCGNYFSPTAPNLEPYSFAQGWRKGNTKAIKDAVKIPVMGMNTIKEPAFAETLLEDGICDFVGVGRGHLADPEWVRKAATDRCGEIRKCIGCMYCFESLMTVGYVRCSVNPRLGLENAFHNAPEHNGNGRKIAVVGGGPAGMQAASLLGQRGFDVTLFEKESELGGALRLAGATAPYKDKILKLRDTMAHEVEHSGVTVSLNTTASPEQIAALNPEAVFLAAGAIPLHPALPGLDRSNVLMANDVIEEKGSPSGRIAIIGSGLTGLETGELLCHKGCVEQLYMVDMQPQIGTGIYPFVLGDVLAQMNGYPVELLPGHKLDHVDDNGVHLIKTADNSSVTLPVDYVVLAMGLKPDSDVVSAYEKRFDRVVVLGENHAAPGRIATSIHDAYIAAYSFDPEA